MTAKAYSYGYELIFVDDMWRYADTLEPSTVVRACKRCGRRPTKEGYDACLGHIEGAVAACCGHGAWEGYVMYEKDTTTYEN